MLYVNVFLFFHEEVNQTYYHQLEWILLRYNIYKWIFLPWEFWNWLCIVMFLLLSPPLIPDQAWGWSLSLVSLNTQSLDRTRWHCNWKIGYRLSESSHIIDTSIHKGLYQTIILFAYLVTLKSWINCITFYFNQRNFGQNQKFNVRNQFNSH